MNAYVRLLVFVVLITLAAPDCLNAQSRAYVGVVAGISTLSADGRSVVGSDTSAVSLYKPENGPAVNVVGGVALSDLFSLQGNYVWNRNSLTFNSTLSGDTPTFYEQERESSQHAVIGDLLLYFRARDDSLRPYLSGGFGMVHLDSSPGETLAQRGTPSPPMGFSATSVVLRVAVGIDLSIGSGWAFRYSFSETIGRNPISVELSPAGERGLANFQNLFGFIRYF